MLLIGLKDCEWWKRTVHSAIHALGLCTAAQWPEIPVIRMIEILMWFNSRYNISFASKILVIAVVVLS